jgi:hypothetical protein
MGRNKEKNARSIPHHSNTPSLQYPGGNKKAPSALRRMGLFDFL